MPAYLLHQKQHDTNLLSALLLEAMSDDGCIPLMDKASLIDDDDREALRALSSSLVSQTGDFRPRPMAHDVRDRSLPRCLDDPVKYLDELPI